MNKDLLQDDYVSSEDSGHRNSKDEDCGSPEREKESHLMFTKVVNVKWPKTCTKNMPFGYTQKFWLPLWISAFLITVLPLGLLVLPFII